jgi:hypothetical protein
VFFCSTDRGILIGFDICHSDAPESAMVSAKFTSIFSRRDEPIQP